MFYISSTSLFFGSSNGVRESMKPAGMQGLACDIGDGLETSREIRL